MKTMIQGAGTFGSRTASRNVNLTDEFDTLVLAKFESGRYEHASEVVRTALRTLEREEPSMRRVPKKTHRCQPLAPFSVLS